MKARDQLDSLTIEKVNLQQKQLLCAAQALLNRETKQEHPDQQILDALSQMIRKLKEYENQPDKLNSQKGKFRARDKEIIDLAPGDKITIEREITDSDDTFLNSVAKVLNVVLQRIESRHQKQAVDKPPVLDQVSAVMHQFADVSQASNTSTVKQLKSDFKKLERQINPIDELTIKKINLQNKQLICAAKALLKLKNLDQGFIDALNTIVKQLEKYADQPEKLMSIKNQFQGLVGGQAISDKNDTMLESAAKALNALIKQIEADHTAQHTKLPGVVGKVSHLMQQFSEVSKTHNADAVKALETKFSKAERDIRSKGFANSLSHVFSQFASSKGKAKSTPDNPVQHREGIAQGYQSGNPASDETMQDKRKPRSKSDAGYIDLALIREPVENKSKRSQTIQNPGGYIQLKKSNNELDILTKNITDVLTVKATVSACEKKIRPILFAAINEFKQFLEVGISRGLINKDMLESMTKSREYTTFLNTSEILTKDGVYALIDALKEKIPAQNIEQINNHLHDASTVQQQGTEVPAESGLDPHRYDKTPKDISPKDDESNYSIKF